MKKALCVGIDSYENIGDLHGCVNDANSVKNVLERNGDGSLNFQVKIMCSTSEASYISRTELKDAVRDLFEGEAEIALFYYAGHGSFDEISGYLCTSEVKRSDEGLSLNDVMALASESQAKNKIIILDSCFSGLVATQTQMQNYSLLNNGTVILAACDANQYASEELGQGVFTRFFVEGLYGGAMNLLGEVSPGSIYAYIDRSLGAWEQRPIFKANIKSFVSLRKNTPPIDISELRKMTEIFENQYGEYKLDPSYEPNKNEIEDKTSNKEHEEIFALLQKYEGLNLVVPVGEKHMYYAALHSKSCKLTTLGQHYWVLITKNLI